MILVRFCFRPFTCESLCRKSQWPHRNQIRQNNAVAANGREYIARFNDSRIHSFHFYWKEGENFKEVVRVAVLDRVSNMSGPWERVVSRLGSPGDPLVRVLLRVLVALRRVAPDIFRLGLYMRFRKLRLIRKRQPGQRPRWHRSSPAESSYLRIPG